MGTSLKAFGFSVRTRDPRYYYLGVTRFSSHTRGPRGTPEAKAGSPPPVTQTEWSFKPRSYPPKKTRCDNTNKY